MSEVIDDYSYSNYNCKELRSLCKERMIKNYSGKNKTELITLIEKNDTYVVHDTISLLVDHICSEEMNDKKTTDSREEYDILASLLNQQCIIKDDIYDITIRETERILETIELSKSYNDGRIDSAIKEDTVLSQIKSRLLSIYPDWEISISPPRASCDIMINGIRINLKLTDCLTSDNSVNKAAIYYSITGLTNYPFYSNWNKFWELLEEAKINNNVKKIRDRKSEYHYLVKNKKNGDTLLKSIFDIHTYVSNASNDLQINWKNEFRHKLYYTEDTQYLEKVKGLLYCLQSSVKQMIERTQKFANGDIDKFIYNGE